MADRRVCSRQIAPYAVKHFSVFSARRFPGNLLLSDDYSKIAYYRHVPVAGGPRNQKMVRNIVLYFCNNSTKLYRISIRHSFHRRCVCRRRRYYYLYRYYYFG